MIIRIKKLYYKIMIMMMMIMLMMMTMMMMMMMMMIMMRIKHYYLVYSCTKTLGRVNQAA